MVKSTVGALRGTIRSRDLQLTGRVTIRPGEILPDGRGFHLILLFNSPHLNTGYIKTLGPGSHAEVYALDRALQARPDAKLEDFMLYVAGVRKASTRGSPVPRCPDCEIITDGVEFIPSVMKYGKREK